VVCSVATVILNRVKEPVDTLYLLKTIHGCCVLYNHCHGCLKRIRVFLKYKDSSRLLRMTGYENCGFHWNFVCNFDNVM